jgi:hypothetical protein
VPGEVGEGEELDVAAGVRVGGQQGGGLEEKAVVERVGREKGDGCGVFARDEGS